MLTDVNADLVALKIPRSRTTKRKEFPAIFQATAVLPTNQNRVQLEVYNNSTGILYLGWGTDVSELDFTVKIKPGGYWQPPIGCCDSLKGLFQAGATGKALITEYLE